MDRAIGHMWHEQHGGYCGEKATEKSQGWWGRREDRRLDKNNYFDMPDLKMQIQKKCAGTYIYNFKKIQKCLGYRGPL